MREHSSKPTTETDPDKLAEALRAELALRRRALNNSGPGTLEGRLSQALQEIEQARVISAHWPVNGTSLPTRLIALVRKITRQTLRWYINPIVEQQNAYNTVAAQMLQLLIESCIDLRAQTEATPTNPPPSTSSIPAPNASAAALQALVRERALAEPPASFPDLELHALSRQLKLREQVTAHWPLTGTTVRGRSSALVRKLMRRYLRWYINPIVEQQNAANSALSEALIGCVRLDAEQRGQIAAKHAHVLEKANSQPLCDYPIR